MAKKRILIVGGGMAGLAAAYYLCYDERFDITLIEASDRLGGRVRTDYSHDSVNEVGGFMLFPWYDFTLRLIDDMGLSHDIRKVRDTTEVFWDVKEQQFKKKGRIPLQRLLPLAFLKDPSLTRILFKRAFYEPDLRATESVGAFTKLAPITGNDSPLLTILDNVLEGFCYGSLREIPASLYLGFVGRFLRYGGFSSTRTLFGGMQQLVDALETELKRSGVTIKLFSPATPSDVSEADIVIRADGHPAVAGMPAPSGTKYFSISGTFDKPFQDEWMVAYTELRKQSPRLVSIGRIIGTSDRQFIACVKVNNEDARTYTEEQIITSFKQDLAVYFPGTAIKQLHAVHYWPSTMPIVTEAYVTAVRAMQGKESTYYVGDYFSGPCIESAVSSAHRIAKILIGS